MYNNLPALLQGFDIIFRTCSVTRLEYLFLHGNGEQYE